jgi:hypothetical protein
MEVSPWDFGWEALVAIATFTLAAVTVVLAARTSKMASKTADLADFTKQDVALSRTAIEGDVRPVLIAIPHGEFVHDQAEKSGDGFVEYSRIVNIWEVVRAVHDLALSA